MMVYAIDPGTDMSGIVVVGVTREVKSHGVYKNDDLIATLRGSNDDMLVIEGMSSYGMPVGAEVLKALWWSGRFYQAWVERNRRAGVSTMLRRDVKLHLCGTARAKDANIRQVLLDRYAEQFRLSTKDVVGRRSLPGPLYGLKGHEFAALAVAVTWLDQYAK